MKKLFLHLQTSDLERKMESELKKFKKSKKGKIVFGQIILLLKNIYFMEISREKDSWQKLKNQGFKERYSFLISPYFSGSCNIGFKDNAIEAIEVISEISVACLTVLSNGSKECFAETIKETIKESLSDKEIFNIDLMFSDRSKSLFELVATKNPIEFAELIWQKIYHNFVESINEWIVIYPLFNFYSPSFSLNFDGISVLNFNDKTSWQNLTSNFDEAEYWYFSDDKRYDEIFEKKADSWLICRVSGTANSAKYSASKFMKTFTSVLFSQLYAQQSGLLGRVVKEPETYSIQFSSNQKMTQENGLTSSIGVILPSSREDIITEQTIQSVTNW